MESLLEMEPSGDRLHFLIVSENGSLQHAHSFHCLCYILKKKVILQFHFVRADVNGIVGQ